MESLKTELVSQSHAIGSRIPLWTQGAGGNISVKDSNQDRLWIKASGLRLADVSLAHGIAGLPLLLAQQRFAVWLKNREASELPYAEFLKTESITEDGKGRASMESCFHALLTKKWVFHFHSIAAHLFWHDQEMSLKLIQQSNLKTALKVAWIPATKPGLDLALEISRFADCDVFILQNHGIVLQSDDPSEESSLLDIWAHWELELAAKLGYTKLKNWSALSLQELIPEIKLHPNRVLFPDAAVFSETIQDLDTQIRDRFATESHLKSRGDILAWIAALSPRQLEAFEIWLATQAALNLQPNLEPWSQNLATAVQALPTEQFRKGKLT